jgi:Ca2+-binding RTX toxin-like protein
MANITGTKGIDTLTGTTDNDIIQGLGGNDRIIASGGSDLIDGGTGKDSIDYSALNDRVVIGFDNDLQNFVVFKPGFFRDDIKNIETIIGDPNKSNISNSQTNLISFENSDKLATIDVDLSANKLTYSSQLASPKTINIKNFNYVTGGPGNDRFVGDSSDNVFLGSEGDNVVIGSKGNDSLGGGFPIDDGHYSTLDYSNLGHAVKLVTNSITLVNGPGGAFSRSTLDIDKGSFGKDSITGFQKITGATNQKNTIDGSSFNSLSSLDLNLASNSLKVKIPDPRILQGELKIEVINFVDVIGSRNDDKIIGGNKNSKLTGSGGNDTITGGNKNDIITGSDSTARGVGEVDILTGGGGRDKFVLGDKNGAYYVGKGKDDYATITDFNLFQDSIDLGGFKDYSFASGSNNTIELYSGKDVNTRDLIAKIQLASGISTPNRNSRSVMGANSSIEAITAKIDMISGSNS